MVLTIIMLIMWLYSARWPRTSPRLKKHLPKVYAHLNHYTSFARSHILYIPCIALVFVHVLQVVTPHMATGDTWFWIVGPWVLFVLDKLLRTWNQTSRHCSVHQMAQLPGRMVALRFSRPPGFVYSPGMFVSVRLPGAL